MAMHTNSPSPHVRELIDSGSLNNAQRSLVFFTRAMAHLDAGQNDRAILDFSSAIDANPTYVLAYSNRGLAHQNRGELDAAIADATKAIELAPQFAVGYANRSWAHQLRGELDDAINDATKAIGVNPKFGQAYINRAVAHRNKGFRERAIADYAVGTELDPGNGKALRAYGLLQFDGGDFEGASSHACPGGKAAGRQVHDALSVSYRGKVRPPRCGSKFEDSDRAVVVKRVATARGRFVSR